MTGNNKLGICTALVDSISLSVQFCEEKVQSGNQQLNLEALEIHSVSQTGFKGATY